MRFRPLAAFVVLATLGCEPLSATPEGRDDAVRYQLPANAIGILEHADSMELLALGDREPYGEEPAPGERFADRPVLGRTTVDPSEHLVVAGALYRAIGRATGQALCFAPHHGLRARRGGEVLELAICYGCLQMEILGDDGPNISIAPSELAPVLDPRIEEGAGLRFETGDVEFPHGRWVARAAGE